MMRFMRILKHACLALTLVLGVSTFTLAITTDIVFVVDESGSMSTEHAWLSTMVNNLEAGLSTAGVTNNRYSLIGYGGHAASDVPHQHTVGLGDWGTAAELSTATGGLVTSGGFEDGWNGIKFGLTNLTFRAGAVKNFILVTDEDRDNQNNLLTYASILADLNAANALLNAVVNNPFSSDGGNSLGVDSMLKGYVADGLGGYTTHANGVVGNGSGATETDYVALALATGGAAWDLNQLRAGGNTATSFTAAFVDIKVEETIIRPPDAVIPEPSTWILLGSGLAGLAWYRRKKTS